MTEMARRRFKHPGVVSGTVTCGDDPTGYVIEGGVVELPDALGRACGWAYAPDAPDAPVQADPPAPSDSQDQQSESPQSDDTAADAQDSHGRGPGKSKGKGK